MYQDKKASSEFIAYEYKEVTVNTALVSMYLDAYESFGWQSDDNFASKINNGKSTLHLRRDRKIINKMELTRLQRNFEANIEELNVLEKSKVSLPKIIALSIGIFGTAFMAGSVFAITATPPIVWLCALLGAFGIIGWILPNYLYKKLIQKRTMAVTPLIEDKYDEIYKLCQKGHALIN